MPSSADERRAESVLFGRSVVAVAALSLSFEICVRDCKIASVINAMAGWSSVGRHI